MLLSSLYQVVLTLCWTHLCFSLSEPPASAGPLGAPRRAASQESFLAVATFAISPAQKEDSISIRLSSTTVPIHDLWLFFLRFCIPPSLVWWRQEGVWVQRRRKSKLSLTLVSWKGAKTQAPPFNASTNDGFHLQQTLLAGFFWGLCRFNSSPRWQWAALLNLSMPIHYILTIYLLLIGISRENRKF